MKARTRVWMMIVLLASLVLPTSVSLAETDLNLPIDIQGDLNGAAYEIRVPENWNGTLLVYAHGYPQYPVPVPEMAFPGDEMAQIFLNRGYALAASGYRGAGFNLREGMEDTKALTEFFASEIAEPDHVILYGISMGGDIALKSIELWPDLYDGIIPIGATGGGALQQFDKELDFSVAYDAAFGWPDEWGELGDVRDDMDNDMFYDLVFFGKVLGEIDFPGESDYPLNQERWEFIRRVTGLPLAGYYMYDGPVDMPPAAIAKTFFMTFQIAELETRAGGPVLENAGKVYTLSRRDIKDLASMGLDAEPLLATMNENTNITGDPDARAWVSEIGDFSGEISVPVLMAHNVEDSITPLENTLDYLATLKAAGTQEHLVRVYSTLPGHCNFSNEQMLTLVEAMMQWLDTGHRPNQSQFPISMGFTHRQGFGN